MDKLFVVMDNLAPFGFDNRPNLFGNRAIIDSIFRHGARGIDFATTMHCQFAHVRRLDEGAHLTFGAANRKVSIRSPPQFPEDGYILQLAQTDESIHS